MLLTDSNVITTDDLTAIDGEIERITETSKGSIDPSDAVQGAWEECAHIITARIQAYGGGLWAGFGVGSGHLAAVYNTGSTGSYSQPRARLSNIVTNNSQYPNSKSSLERWMQYTGAYLFFRDASTRVAKDTDRLAMKMDRYNVERKTAWGRIEANGLPVVLSPLSCPGALHEPNTGTWDETNVVVSGSTSVTIGHDVAITWVGADYLTTNGNAESAGSSIISVQWGFGQTITVSIASLNPATGNYQTQGLADGVTPGMAAVGWNLYAGEQGQPLTLQNTTPLALSVKTAAITTFRTGGPYLGQGQYAFRNLAFVRTIQRG